MAKYKRKVYRNDKKQLHSPDDDTPAIWRSDGAQQWFKNGKPHRVNGPAKISADGLIVWWMRDGNLHRTDGPACTGRFEDINWWVKGKAYGTNRTFQKAANLTDEEMVTLVLKYGNIR